MDLNDLRYFALIVEHGGFTAAERLTRVTKSKLSRRIALLEERLGVRLFQRSTRRLAVTEAGRAFYEHCAAMLIEAEAAEEAIEQLRSEPSGTVRLTCAASMAQAYVTRLVAEYMRKYPKVRVELDATDRVVNLVEERVDVALRVYFGSITEPGLVARRLASGRMILVASAAYLDGRAPILEPADLVHHDTIGSLRLGANQNWTLIDTGGHTAKVELQPRLLCSDFVVQQDAVIGGIGVALLPLRLAWKGLAEQTLVRVAKDWNSPEADIHVVYPSRRGMLPSVRKLVEHLVERVPLALGG